MSFFMEKAIGSKVESAGKSLGITDDGGTKEEKERKKEQKEKREMEERKKKYLEERREKRHEENKARNDKIRNKYTLAEKEEEKKSGYSLFTKQEPKKNPQQTKKNPQHASQICVVEGCNKSSSVVQPVCPQCDQPVCYSHRLEADHPCSAVAIVKGAAGSVLDSVRDYVDSSTLVDSGAPSEKKEKGGEEETPIVQRGLGEKSAAKEEQEEEEFSWDLISRRLEETKESLSDAVQSSLRELNLAGEPELTEEEKRYWGGLPEDEKGAPPHHRGTQEEEKGMDFVDEVTTSISSWFSGDRDQQKGSAVGNQQKESEGSSFFSWF